MVLHELTDLSNLVAGSQHGQQRLGVEIGDCVAERVTYSGGQGVLHLEARRPWYARVTHPSLIPPSSIGSLMCPTPRTALAVRRKPAVARRGQRPPDVTSR